MLTGSRLRPFRPFVSAVLSVALVVSAWTGTILFPTPASAASAPVTKVFQEGLDGYAGTQCSYVSKGFPNDTNETKGLSIGKNASGTTDIRIFCQFDLSSIPQHATIASASFELTRTPFGATPDAAVPVSVHKVNTAWDQGIITWNNSVTTAIYDPTPVKVQTINAIAPRSVATFDITPLARQWVDRSAPNYGIMLQVAELPVGITNWSRGFSHEELTLYPADRPKLTVTYTIPPTGVDVTPTTLSLVQGGSTGQLSATVLPDTATNKTVTWTSSNSAVATVDVGGVVTPIGPGTATITATTEDGNYTDTSTVTVKAPNVPATGVDVTPSTLSLIQGGSAGQLSATVLPDTATNKTVTWSSSNTAVATVDAVGVVTPIGPGTATITATTEDGNYTDASTVTVSSANLSNLVLSEGLLTPTFNGGTTNYTVAVLNGVNSLTVTPSVYDPNATVKVNGKPVTSGTASEPILLNVGDNNVVDVTVTAQDGTTTKTYTVTVTRAAASSNADLNNLTLSDGTLAPAFNGGTTSYSATVANSVYSLTVTPTTADPNATVTVNGTPVASGMPSQAISLNVGNNEVTVTVTAQDGTKKTYTIVITRKAAAPAPTDDGGSDSSDSDGSGGSSGGGAWTPTAPVNPTNPPVDKPDTDKPSEHSGGAACTKLTWSDIQNHWAKADIESASQLCVVQGPSSDKFLPDDEVTRLQFALMVARAMKLQAAGNVSNLEAFEDRQDIPGWAAAELTAAVQAGIIEGYDDNTLRPNEKISRAEMITMLIRGWNMSASYGATTFADDADIPDWAKGYVAKAEKEGIIEGRSNNRFEPSGTATRAEATVVLVRMLRDKP
ncbi:cadherin-like beta sandwich domain-containing protein [Paenibacillus sp. GYB003]|uniref:cadherin-like beta sandwich domain-containing protein n=1 Tax=Paenibacillus sp. GYB003 TaxID=2994392 RepID=UPI002F969BDA